MDRRSFIASMLGVSALAVGGSLVAGKAEAMPLIDQLGGLDPRAEAEPAVAAQEDVDGAHIERVWHRGRPHYGWGPRRRYVRRYRWRPRVRRCFWRRNRWGRPVRVCRF